MIDQKLFKRNVKFHVEEVSVKGFPQLEIDKKVAFFEAGQGKNKQMHVVNPSVGSSYKRKTPAEVFESYPEDSVHHFFEINDFKQLYINHGETRSFVEKEIKFSFSVVDVYRYDREQDIKFVRMEIQTPILSEDKLVVHLPYKDNYFQTYKFMITSLSKINNSFSTVRDMFYRFYTANKSNGYLGYASQKEIPNKLRGRASVKLAELGTYVTTYSNKLGFDGFSVFIAWLNYWNTEKTCGKISQQLFGTEREPLEDFIGKFYNFVRHEMNAGNWKEVVS